MILAARGETQHAASLALLDDGGVRESPQLPDTASFRVLAFAEKASRSDALGFTTGC
jgi:hypothetical protein